MNHNGDDKIDRLFTTARGFRPDTANAENHFETRLMARIRAQRSTRVTWISWAWRLIPGFTALAAMLAIASMIMETNGSQDIVSAVIRGSENQIIASHLIGG